MEKHLFAQVSYKEFLEIMKDLNTAKNYITHGHLIDNYVYLYRGGRQHLKIKLDWFKPNPICSPDFNDFSIIDHGQTIKFGEYEVGVNTILYEFDKVRRKELDNDSKSGCYQDLIYLEKIKKEKIK